MSETYPGKLMTNTFLATTLRENVHRVLDNYVGITVAHYRRSTTATKDFYGDYSVSDPVLISESHLIHMTPQDYDVLSNGIAHVEGLLPIEVILDPTEDWLAGDEIEVGLNTRGQMYSRRFSLAKIMAESHDNVTIYERSNIAPVREDRDGCPLND